MEILIKYVFVGFLTASLALFFADSPIFQREYPHIHRQLVADPLFRMILAFLVVLSWPIIWMAALSGSRW